MLRLDKLRSTSEYYKVVLINTSNRFGIVDISSLYSKKELVKDFINI